jgi:hypothetical protein
MTIKDEIDQAIYNAGNVRITVSDSKGITTFDPVKRTVTALYLDRNSFAQLMNECSMRDIINNCEFRGVPVYIVRKMNGDTGKHIRAVSDE